MTDIRFSTDDYSFSYRVAGICINDGKVLLQKMKRDSGFALPGGHVAFGETNEQTLIREFKEETGADITVGSLKWVGEIFFPLGGKKGHQICLYYDISDVSGLPGGDSFISCEAVKEKGNELCFYWISIERLREIELYPTNAYALLENMTGGVTHFVYRES